ncbi:sensor histidine kinase [Thermomonospora umbrina]|uniref:histidine kinase n=1 Tax=Thermomonospora umbrina TaxID=111806 RepID=A0A3D9SMP0_9ACTN|nr:HAMP domain-containing sensor histidine kinase [Thermomonospora umbrina]REE95680.1 signal transduction histidine kinase [Thermomonospora umbrina]
MAADGRRRHASRRSVQWRLTFLATGIVGLAVCLGVLGLYQALYWMAMNDLRERGTAAARAVAANPEGAGRGARAGELPVREQTFHLLQSLDGRGRVLARSPALRGRPAISDVRPPSGGRPVTRRIDVAGVPAQVYLVAVRAETPKGPRIGLAGAPMDDVQRAQRTYAVSASVGILILLPLVWWIVWSSVGRALKPFGVMGRELAQITGGHMERRVTVPDTDDEVADLARSVNVTLQRLQRFVEGQRKFVADASHELRSPLTALRAQLEVALAHPDDEDWPAVALAALSEADRLQRVVTDVLMLAKLDAGVRTEREPVDLGELARTEAERPRRVPVHVQVRDVAHPVVVSGSRSQLVRVLTNLLDNAERHARSEIRISVRREDGQAVLEVADDGSGIPPEERERVFQRFQRLTESRRRDAHGTGLGLPIARDVCVAHGGGLVAEESEQGGALMVVRLPLREPDPSAP